MRIYISTPVNARQEDSFAEKYQAARKRVQEIEELLQEDFRLKDAQTVSTFDLNPLGTTETQAIGRCIQAVLESDLLYIDKTPYSSESKGCLLESTAAEIYKIPVITKQNLRKG